MGGLARSRESGISKRATVLTALAAIVLPILVNTPSASAAGGACSGFEQTLFIDSSPTNGIADSNGVIETPWKNIVDDFTSTSEYDFTVPAGASSQWITINPGAVPDTANGQGDADVGITCAAKEADLAIAAASFPSSTSSDLKTSGQGSRFSLDIPTTHL